MKKNVLMSFLVSFLLFISCSTDDSGLIEHETTINSGQLIELDEQFSVIESKVFIAQTNCDYRTHTVTFDAGNKSGCDILDWIVQTRTSYALIIDPTSGCPMYRIPEINYFNCYLMQQGAPIVEVWEKLATSFHSGIFIDSVSTEITFTDD